MRRELSVLTDEVDVRVQILFPTRLGHAGQVGRVAHEEHRRRRLRHRHRITNTNHVLFGHIYLAIVPDQSEIPFDVSFGLFNGSQIVSTSFVILYK